MIHESYTEMTILQRENYNSILLFLGNHKLYINSSIAS